MIIIIGAALSGLLTGFPLLAQAMHALKKQDFESITEWHSNNQINYLTGIIHFEKLAQNDWWKNNGV